MSSKMSEEDTILYNKYKEEAEYYDRLQYVFKIKLNSLYGALSNLWFRFFNINMAESTTGTGRMILEHQYRKVNEILDGEYNINVPLYKTTKEALESGKSADVALDGPIFNGSLQSDAVIYGDSVTGDTLIDTKEGRIPISELYTHTDYIRGEKEYCNTQRQFCLSYDPSTNKTMFKPIKYVMKHKTNKQLYRVWVSDELWLDVTEDHSLMGYDISECDFYYESSIVEVTPQELEQDMHYLICVKHRIETAKKALHQLDFDIVKPTKIEKLSLRDGEYVYDIEVDDTHTFFANNILVHNTDSVYFNTYCDNKEDACAVADAVADKVNKSFPEFMRSTFLCNPGFDEIIKTGREIVGSKGIFVEKKRYIIQVVDSEGKAADKRKTMGLDIRKTTIPTAVSSRLTSFLERLLKDESWEKISKDVVDYKDELRNTSDIMTIGLPKGIKGIEEYTRAFNTDSGTRLPGHVAAGIHYNTCLKTYNDKDSLPIMSGMKIKVFYLNQSYRRFKSIAIPTDAEFVPTWFLENFTVDKEAHILRLVDRPLENILKAINKKCPTKQSLLFADAWEF